MFREDPSLEDAIQVAGDGNSCNVLANYDSNAHRSAFCQIDDGDPAVVARLTGPACRFRIGSLPPRLAADPGTVPAKALSVLGDIVRLRPSEKAMGRVELFLESRQAEAADRVGPPLGRFHLGRITAGGPMDCKWCSPTTPTTMRVCSLPAKSGSFGTAIRGSAWQIDVPAGQKTRIHLRLENPDKLGELEIVRTPIVYTPSTDCLSPVLNKSSQERK